MELKEFVSGIADFGSWNHVRKIKLFGWYLHCKKNKDRFSSSEIRSMYEDLSEDKPSNIATLLDQLGQKSPKEVMKDKRGYQLTRAVRDSFESTYGGRAAAVYVDKLLRSLPERVVDLAERTYLDEALMCFNHGAFRGSIIMCWNLAFDHLCQFILSKHLVIFNAQLIKSYPKADISSISKRDDFSDLKEFQVLMVSKSAAIVSDSLFKVLKEKLDRRNIAAHPSGIITTQPTAEHFIIDLVENVVLKLT